MKVTVELTREQAQAVADACEQYLRQRIGQFDAIAEDLSFMAVCSSDTGKMSDMEFERCLTSRSFLRDGMEQLYRTAVKSDGLYLVGLDRAYTAEIVWLAIRNALAWHDHPEGGMWVEFGKPLNRSKTPTPKVTIEEDAKNEM